MERRGPLGLFHELEVRHFGEVLEHENLESEVVGVEEEGGERVEDRAVWGGADDVALGDANEGATGEVNNCWGDRGVREDESRFDLDGSEVE